MSFRNTSDGCPVRRRTRSVQALLHEFLRVYPTDLPTFGDLREDIAGGCRGQFRSSPPSLRKWRQRCLDFKLLEADGGTPFVQELVANTEDPDEILTTAGLDAGLARCEFLKSGIRKYLSGASVRNWRGIVLMPQRLIECSRSSNAKASYALTNVPHDSKSLLHAASTICRPICLAPKRKIGCRSFFVRHFGHPNLRSRKHRWAGVPEDIRRVVIRWLVERVLDQFFLLIKETALDRHWKYREAFWKAYVRHGSDR